MPSYFDYVRLRNHLRTEAADAFVGVCEYTEHPEAARHRTFFRQVRVFPKFAIFLALLLWSPSCLGQLSVILCRVLQLSPPAHEHFARQQSF